MKFQACDRCAKQFRFSDATGAEPITEPMAGAPKMPKGLKHINALILPTVSKDVGPQKETIYILATMDICADCATQLSALIQQWFKERK